MNKDLVCIKCNRKLLTSEVWQLEQYHKWYDTGLCNRCQEKEEYEDERSVTRYY